MADSLAQIQAVTFPQFVRAFKWQQGEHVGMIGPTGSGKTTLALSLLNVRRYVVVFATKPRDATLDELVKYAGYKKIDHWKGNLSPYKVPRRILWPNARSLYAAEYQRKRFREAMRAIYDEGNWCVYLDELWMMDNFLKLNFEIRVYLQQARSLGISLIAGTQRPRYVPLEVYDQSTHLFFWRDNDEENLKRISGISWLNSRMVRQAVANLERHEVLYINTRNSDVYMMRFVPPPPKGK